MAADDDAEMRGFPGYLTIDLAALQRNFRRLASLAAPALVAGVVKADAYGLGSARLASGLRDVGCRHFFVAHLTEAIALRPHLPTNAQLFVLNGLLPGTEATCASDGIIPVINSFAQLHRWCNHARAHGSRMSMDSMTIDISSLPENALALGSVVEVIGPHQTLEMLAADAGTIAYEILTSLGHRFRRNYCRSPHDASRFSIHVST